MQNAGAMALCHLDGVQQTVVAHGKRVDPYHLDDADYLDYRRAELARARRDAETGKSQVGNVLLTFLACVVIILILVREGLFGN